ncbi:MAG: HYR domain-containing protein, partial [Gillisia sp.]|nr:HYR domain-containing protein [Gillisia sp.]
MSGIPKLQNHPDDLSPFSPGKAGFWVVLTFLMVFVGWSVVGQNPVYSHDASNSRNLDYFSLTVADAFNSQAKINRLIIAVDVNPAGDRFVLTFGNGIKRVGDTDGLIDFIPNQNDRLSNSLDFAINSEGKFFVATNESNRRFIRVYSPTGVYLPDETLGDGTYGNGSNQFRGPTGLAFDKDDNLYVADHYIGNANPPPTNPSFIKIYRKDALGKYKNNLIKEFDRIQGTLLNFPYRLAVNSQGQLYMAELGQDGNAKVKILQFDAGFNPTQIGEITGAASQIGSPGSIIIDKFDNIFIADLGNDLDLPRFLEATNNVNEFYDIFEIIKRGIQNNLFNINVYNPNNSFNNKISAQIDLPVDLSISPCGTLYVNNAIFDGTIISTIFGRIPDITIDFDLEAYQRSPGYDTENPTITCPSNITETVAIGQTGKMVSYTLPVFNDNCSGSSMVQTAGLAPGSNFPLGITLNTFVVTDASGKTANCSFTVTITADSDTEAPVITCPAAIVRNVDPGICGAIVNYTNPAATDNSGSATVSLKSGPSSGSLFPVGITTVTFEATDAAGNKADCSFIVTVIDNE